MAMLDVARDALCGCPRAEGVEIEFRFPLLPLLFDTIHRQWAAYKGVAVPEPSVSRVMYSDADDLRCVNGDWQRKRTLVYRRLPTAVRSALVVSIESPAAPPQQEGYSTMTRIRWSYVTDPWRVDFTKSSRACNVEVEFIGSVESLVYHAKNGGDMFGLWSLLNAMVARLSVNRVCRLDHCAPCTRSMPFIRIEMTCPLLHPAARERLVCIMQRNQPISMTANAAVLECPLVSLKYDGVRVAVRVMQHNGTWVAIGVCRRGLPWWIPCLTARCDMVLDCEYMHSTQTFVVFDALYVGGRQLRGSYNQRLIELASLPLPVLSGYTVVVKTVYPLCVLTPAWYDERKQDDEREVDGLILHDGMATLDRASSMYKWKPEHTVDLWSGRDNLLMDGKYMPFLTPEPGSGIRAKGEVWECSIVGNHVRPLRVRTDKQRPNAAHVCRDILRAHREKLTIDDVVRILSAKREPVRKSKRKRSAT